jgi:hypothetical protein
MGTCFRQTARIPLSVIGKRATSSLSGGKRELQV